MRNIFLLVLMTFVTNLYAEIQKSSPQPGLNVEYSPVNLNVPASALKLMQEIKKGDDTVHVIYYKSDTIFAVSKMQISFQKLNKKYFGDMTQDSFESTKDIFCTLKAKATDNWPIISSYNYVYDVVSIENIWVGRITADPKKIVCDDLDK